MRHGREPSSEVANREVDEVKSDEQRDGFECVHHTAAPRGLPIVIREERSGQREVHGTVAEQRRIQSALPSVARGDDRERRTAGRGRSCLGFPVPAPSVDEPTEALETALAAELLQEHLGCAGLEMAQPAQPTEACAQPAAHRWWRLTRRRR